MSDPINPTHYKDLHPEPITVIENWNLPYHLGNVVKYVARAGHKEGTPELQDLEKARWYLDRYVFMVKCHEKET